MSIDSNSLNTHTHLCLMIALFAGFGFCDEESTQFLLWPETPAGITRSLPCPNTTTIINRTCNTPGIWDNVDPSLCIPHSSINTVSIHVGDGGSRWKDSRQGFRRFILCTVKSKWKLRCTFQYEPLIIWVSGLVSDIRETYDAYIYLSKTFVQGLSACNSITEG